MVIRTWLVVVLLIATVSVAALIVSPVMFTIMDALNATVPATGEGHDSINRAIAMATNVFPWTIFVIIGGLLVFGFTRPQHRESESWME
jgi:glycerol-3-phosphate acyltransferase PlsY